VRVARRERAGDVRRDRRLAAQVQRAYPRLDSAAEAGGAPGRRRTRRGSARTRDDPLQRRALRALVGEHRRGDAVVAQLARARGVVAVARLVSTTTSASRCSSAIAATAPSIAVWLAISVSKNRSR
jgi:hypothetical protein